MTHGESPDLASAPERDPGHGPGLDPALPADDPLRGLARAGAREQLAPERVARARERASLAWQASNERRRQRRRFWRVALPLAAAAGLVLAAGAYVWRPAFDGPGPPATTTLATVARLGGQLEVDGQLARVGQSLAPGSRLRGSGAAALALAGGGSLRLDGASLTLVAPHQLALESGRLYLDTGSSPTDTASPGPPGEPRGQTYVITTPLAEIRDIGTQFEVGLSRETLSVRVREGAIEVRRDPRAPATRAEAGQSLVLRADQIELASSPRVGQTWRWTEEVAPALAIEGRPLADLLRWVARETGRSWRFADPRLEAAAQEILLHGSVDGLLPEQALEVVLPSCDLAFRRVGDELWLERSDASAETGSPD